LDGNKRRGTAGGLKSLDRSMNAATCAIQIERCRLWGLIAVMGGQDLRLARL